MRAHEWRKAIAQDSEPSGMLDMLLLCECEGL